MTDFKEHHENVKFYSVKFNSDAGAAIFYVISAIIINLFIFL